MAIDMIRKVYEHLAMIEEDKRGKIDIDLFLVSNGGDGTVPWRLVTLIKEFAKKFSVQFHSEHLVRQHLPHLELMKL